MMKNPGIYILTCKINGKQYVGLDSNLPKRSKAHLSKKEKACRIIHNAILKHGKENFDVQIIPYPGISKKALQEVEKFKIAYLNTQRPNGYNITTGGEGIPGHKHSPETRAKLSKASKGKNNFNYGKPRSPEHRAKLSKANKGRPLSPEHRAKLSKAHKGKPLSPEHRAKISKSNKGRSLSPETRAKISKTLMGKTHTPERRAKLREAWKKRKQRENATPKEQLTLFHLF